MPLGLEPFLMEGVPGQEGTLGGDDMLERRGDMLVLCLGRSWLYVEKEECTMK